MVNWRMAEHVGMNGCIARMWWMTRHGSGVNLNNMAIDTIKIIWRMGIYLAQDRRGEVAAGDVQVGSCPFLASPWYRAMSWHK
jgi:hypothetical protein